MRLQVGSVVRARRGRDNGKYFCVVAIDGGFCWLRDGKSRPLDNPKRKNIRHITITNHILTTDALKSDVDLKKALEGFTDV